MRPAILTQHNDNARSGANLQETILKVSNVGVAQFGILPHLDMPVDGHVYAQPLFVPDVDVPGRGKTDVLYVATMNNSVYAFDANSSQQVWKAAFGNAIDLNTPHKLAGGNYHDIQDKVGIIGTPVVSVAHKAIYVVSFSRSGDVYRHDLHALDLAGGAELFGGPTRLEASVPGWGAGSDNGILRFDSVLQNQRPALLLSRGRLYVAFASYGDYGNYHGWVLAYDAATLAPVAAANLTPNSQAGGIWQAGQGPAADDEGNVYVVSGNGSYNAESLAHQVTLGETALGSPAAAAMDAGRLALAWTGNEALRRLNVAYTDNGRDFYAKRTLDDTSLDGPSLCFDNGKLFIAWTGPDALQRLNVMSSADLQQFENKVTLNESGEFGPAIALGGGRIYLAWVGREASRRLNVMSSADGVQWSNKVTLVEQSIVAPALAYRGGKLYLAWVGTDAARSLNIMESNDGVTFQNKVTLPHTSDARPALGGGARLELTWTGIDGNRALMRLTGSNPQTLGNTETYDVGAHAGPALATAGGKLRIMWTDTQPPFPIHLAEVSDAPSLGDCFVKFSPDLKILDWFTPWNTHQLNAVDNDLGSGGILLIPGTDLLTGGGKEGKLYVMRREQLGRFCSTCSEATGERNIVDAFQATAKRNDPPQPAAEAQGFHHIHGSPVFWQRPDGNKVAYLWGEADRLRAYRFNGQSFDHAPVDTSQPGVTTPARSMPGAMLSLTADGSKPGSGILWTVHPTCQDANQGVVKGTLSAFDASALGKRLWHSDEEPGGRDKLGMLAKFTPPTVANGRVYMATFSHKIKVYGHLH